MTAPIRVEVDGREPHLEDLYLPLLTGYGHFTAMQVRGSRVRGLALHLARLSAATRELWRVELDEAEVRARVAHAIRDIPDAAVRVLVYHFDRPMIVVVVRPPSSPPAGPLALRSARYERPAAHIKHLGGFGQGYHAAQAQAAGYDDALLVDHTGAVEEASIYNVGFYDRETVTWPTAAHLAGIAMQLLAARLPEAGVPSRTARVEVGDLGSFRAAFVTNSIGITAVGRIDDVAYEVDTKLMDALARAEAAVPWDAI
ncbi:aminotransferase class IV [Dactylosporangium sp. CA-139066]|uniref:aminotransferase class IV n=1 Tax=Dactylosporangium sp. CA-139066 TaxID=3239930 RepID=UPI003D9448FD